ncbi:MAG: sensor histidine kinase [Caldilineae bacterium]|nr:MAG: sensor histidine kinase [Caldilineae bacterium]
MPDCWAAQAFHDIIGHKCTSRMPAAISWPPAVTASSWSLSASDPIAMDGNSVPPSPDPWLQRLQSLFANRLLNLSGLIVTLSVSGLGLLEYFLNDYPARWPVLTLVSALILLNLSLHFNDWWDRGLWRRRMLLALMAALTIALLFIPPSLSVWIIIFFVLSVVASMMFEPREWTLWIAAFAIISTAYFVTQYGWARGLYPAIIYAGAFYFFASFAKATADAQAAQQRSQQLYEELQAAHRQLQAYARRVEQLTIMEERGRLAREMHDTVGHRLTVSAVQLEAAQRLITQNPEKAAEMVATVREQILQALAELRETVAALRAPVEEDLSLPVSLERLVQQFREGTGIPVELVLDEALPDLDPRQRKAIYRAAQESLTNVQKHARAGRVWVRLEGREDQVRLEVEDDGVGPATPPAAGGFGLRGLRERAAQLGGAFHLEARPAGGARAVFSIPLRYNENAPEDQE